MTIREPRLCSYCKHLHAGPGIVNNRWACSAFKKGIPEDIYAGKTSHREPYEGDNGIRFEPIEGAEE